MNEASRGDPLALQQRLQFLAHASELLGSSLDLDETLAHVACLATESLADWCALDLVDLADLADLADSDPGAGARELRRVAVAHPDPARVALAEELRRRPSFAAWTGLAEVLRTGQPILLPEVTDAHLTRAAQDEEHLRALRAAGVRTAMLVPLLARGRAIGVLTLASNAADRRYDAHDLELALDLARRCAVAVDNARLHSDAQRAREQLARTERRYRELLHDIDAIVWEADARTWQFTFVSEQAERLLGYPVARWLADPAFWVGLIHPEDRDWAVSFCKEESARGSEHDFRYRAIAADGRVVWLHDVVHVVRDADGSPFQLRGVMVDVTPLMDAQAALREGEERLRSVLDHVVDGIITIDERGRIESLNPAAERIFGYRADELLGRDIQTLMPEPYRAAHAASLARYLATGERRILGTPGREVEGLRKDGSRFPLDIAVSEAWRGERRIFTGIVRDITERRRLEEALRQRAAELLAADRRKDEFLALLGHELRNPLAPIQNALELLRHDPEPAAAERARAIMERQVVHMSRLVDDLLDVSRITRGKIQLRRERVRLDALVTSALELTRAALDAAGHEVAVELPPEPVWVDGDPVRIEQVISNLVSNAARYTPPRGHVTISLRREAGEATLSVRDDGVGIEPDQLEAIFEPFTQLRTAGAASAGLGIGLTLVRELVRLHGGAVAAHSEGRGRGAELVVRLPLAAPEAEPPPRAPVAAAAGARRILVVDDNHDSSDTLAQLLELDGHAVRTAYDGAGALAAARSFAPDVVILDIGLPDMSGHDVARAIRAAPGRQPFLVGLSGFGTEADHARARESGFDRYLLKPASLTAIEATLATQPRPA